MEKDCIRRNRVLQPSVPCVHCAEADRRQACRGLELVVGIVTDMDSNRYCHCHSFARCYVCGINFTSEMKKLSVMGIQSILG